MNSRIARKITSRAHPDRYSAAKVLQAITIARRRLALSPPPSLLCNCPADPACRRFGVCNAEAGLDTLEMAIVHGQHPWGDWKCVVQRAAEAL